MSDLDDDFAPDPFKKQEVKIKDKSLGPERGEKRTRVDTAHERGTPKEVTPPAEAPKDVSKTATPSRGVNSLAKTSMKSKYTDETSELEAMAGAEKKVLRTKALLYPEGVTQADVEEFGELEKFVCFTSSLDKGGGVSLSTSGGKNSSGSSNKSQQYFKVAPNGVDVKYQVHKLMLTRKLKLLYSDHRFGKKDEAIKDSGIWDSSHLCHNRLCWRPEHLHNEGHIENMARGGGGGCGGWIYDPTGHRLQGLCTHEPRCMYIRTLKPEWISLT